MDLRQDSHIPPLVFQTLEGRAPAAVDAIVAFPEMMHQLMKQVLYGDRHASLKLLKGYFVTCLNSAHFQFLAPVCFMVKT